MPYCIRIALVTVLLSGLSASVTAEDSKARLLLDKMSHSFRELTYQGAISYQQGDIVQSLRITHAVIDGEEFERLEYMDGERREIIRRGHTLSCIHPGHQLIRLYQQQQALNQLPNSQNDSLYKLTDYYDLSVVGTGRIANRSVVELLVRPKDAHRFIHRLSIDSQTGLLLRSIVEGSTGKVLERFQFADIQIGGAIPKEHFHARDHSYQAEHVDPVLSLSRESALNEEKPWLVNWLPGGFTAVVANQKFASEDMATFTDGFAVFSVFLEKIDQSLLQHGVDSGGEGLARRGATVAYSRAL
ncbi:MAG: MucB/RseB C-terminal domain-containing protein, partial [Spongiibacteraceae bacterium]|nr:MucB/RseB C-terminal domain-containing protein [Spongiibacteraceae bacterium]